MRAPLFVLGLLAPFACSEPIRDVRYDSGVIIADADLTPPRPDAAPFPDAQPFADAATFPDALPAPDANAPPDGGSPRDAAPVDTGLMNYAGPPIDPLTGIGNVELVQEGFGFLEGPVWDADNGVLLFSDITRDRVMRLRPPNMIDTFRSPSNGANGHAIDPQGRLLTCEHTSRSIVRGPLTGGPTQVFAARWNGARFNSPNDVVVRSDGVAFFTDPPYGLVGPREISFNGIYRAVETAGFVNVISEFPTRDESRPNGLVLMPDERIIIIANTSEGHISQFDVGPAGELTGARTWIVTAPDPDGMAIDSIGNIFVATSVGIEVYDMSPPNARWGVIAVPRVPSNVAWGDPDRRTLYITAREGLYRVRLQHAGIHD